MSIQMARFGQILPHAVHDLPETPLGPVRMGRIDPGDKNASSHAALPALLQMASAKNVALARQPAAGHISPDSAVSVKNHGMPLPYALPTPSESERGTAGDAKGISAGKVCPSIPSALLRPLCQERRSGSAQGIPSRQTGGIVCRRLVAKLKIFLNRLDMHYQLCQRRAVRKCIST